MNSINIFIYNDQTIFFITGHFLLTHLLLDKIKAASPSRIIILSSSAHNWKGGVNFDDIQFTKSYPSNGLGAYGQSKAANILHCVQLAKNLQGMYTYVTDLMIDSNAILG